MSENFIASVSSLRSESFQMMIIFGDRHDVPISNDNSEQFSVEIAGPMNLRLHWCRLLRLSNEKLILAVAEEEPLINSDSPGNRHSNDDVPLGFSQYLPRIIQWEPVALGWQIFPQKLRKLCFCFKSPKAFRLCNPTEKLIKSCLNTIRIKSHVELSPNLMHCKQLHILSTPQLHYNNSSSVSHDIHEENRKIV